MAQEAIGPRPVSRTTARLGRNGPDEATRSRESTVALVFVLAAALIGCDPGPQPTGSELPAAAVQDSSGVQMLIFGADAHRAAPLWNLDATRAVTFEDGPGLTSVRSVIRIGTDHWVLLDSGNREVYVFDGSGRFSHRLGRTGQGPGEFNERPSFLGRTPDGEVLIRDWPAGRLQRFDVREGFVEGWDLDVAGTWLQMLWRADGGVSLLTERSGAASNPNERTRNVAAVFEVTSGDDPREVEVFPAMEWVMVLTERGVSVERPWYLPQTLSAVARDGFWFTHGTEWRIERRDAERGELTHVVRFDQPREPFSADVDVPVPAMQPPDSTPPIARLYSDGEGRLWIGESGDEYSALPSGMGRVVPHWIVLEPSGERVLGRVELPGDRRLLHADTEGVLVVGVDEVDVPVIEWYPFVDPGVLN